MDKIEKFFKDIDLPLDHPDLYARVFEQLAPVQNHDPVLNILREEHIKLSHQVDQSGLQDSCSVRNILVTRGIAIYLIDENGRLKIDKIPQILSVLKENMYSLGPDRQHDAKRNEQIQNVLTLLANSKALQLSLNQIGKPFSHKYAEQIVRDTLGLPKGHSITDADARRAALSAWLCYLRQNVGSCFATAPAIIVHDEQPEQFLKDLGEILGTGRLKRTFGGVEYAVPLSYSWGAGDLKRVLLLTSDFFEKEHGIWDSPALQNALIETQVISSRKSVKGLIKNVLDFGEAPYLILSVEEILRRIMLRHFEITEEDLVDFENRPRGMIQTSMIMNTSSLSTGGKSTACTKFLQQFLIAKNLFKSLSDNALLKSWEFTVASFAESKAQFTKWNLYSSLGLGTDEPEGIGQCLYNILNRKLQECNNKAEEYQIEYEQLFHNLKFIENRFRNADEKQAQWLRAEYQSRKNEFNLMEELRDRMRFKAQRYANLFNDLIEVYYETFPKYFQEVYDADMHEVVAGPFDDSPAGFRLLYKHGRSNSALWTRIHNHNEFIDALAAFFTASETEISSHPSMEGLEDDITEITTSVVNHIRTKEFIESAFARMAKIHNTPMIKDPLNHLDKIEKKPWAYTSGGAMTNLVSSYFKLGEKPSDVDRWVENPMELLVFIIDKLKELPQNVLEAYRVHPKKSMLMHSPTHAFLLKPGLDLIRQGWESKQYTYTWVRDYMVNPMKQKANEIFLDEEKIHFIINELEKNVPANYLPFYRKFFGGVRGSMHVQELRKLFVDGINQQRGLQMKGRPVLTSDEVDRVLYRSLPLFRSYKLQEYLDRIFNEIPGLSEVETAELHEIVAWFSDKYGGQRVLSARQLMNYAKMILSIGLGTTRTSIDYPLEISKAAQKLGFALSAPVIFADTNWVKDLFGFVVNPGTGELQLWRMDYTGVEGEPMSVWNKWLNGSQKEPKWGIFNKPIQYQS